MCGIVGMVNLAPMAVGELVLDKWMAQMLFLDQLRGIDSTGVCLVKGTDVHMLKKAMPAADFLQLRETGALLDKAGQSHYAIGHNRAKTRGGATLDNAHPFQHGTITLVHNGTLKSHFNLLGNFTVDSEAICNNIAVEGAQRTLEKLNGAYTLVWHDSADNSINFARNEERPLHGALINKGTALLYASESWMLCGAAKRNAIKIEKLFEFPTLQHLKITQDMKSIVDMTRTSFTEFVPLATSYDYGSYHGRSRSQSFLTKYDLAARDLIDFTPVEFKEYTAGKGMGNLKGTCAVANVSGRACFLDVTVYNISKSRGERLLTAPYLSGLITNASILENKEHVSIDHNSVRVALPKKDIKLIGDSCTTEVGAEDDLPFLWGPHGRIVSADVFAKLTDGGCASCSCNLEESDHEDIAWTAEGAALCVECSEVLGEGKFFGKGLEAGKG